MILVGDVLDKLATLESNSVHCVVTSPPYWGLRDYGAKGQLGLEDTPAEFVGNMRMVFDQVKRVLRKDGTLWLNLGDSYARNGGTRDGGSRALMHMSGKQKRMTKIPPTSGLKEKDLCGIPWRIAFALQSDGWYLRQDIIWHKPNPMPESVRDRCTKAHEYIFLMAKSEKYYFDVEAIKEPAKAESLSRYKYKFGGKKNEAMTSAHTETGLGSRTHPIGTKNPGDKRQKRSVWTVTTKSFKGAHFATFPTDLIEPCIIAGCPAGGTVLDPFFGAGTTGLVAKRTGRNFIGIELNEEYAAMAAKRIEAG